MTLDGRIRYALNLGTPEGVALAAVLDLHKPVTPPPGQQWVSGGDAAHCEGCSCGDPFLDEAWPCRTVLVIAEALGLKAKVGE